MADVFVSDYEIENDLLPAVCAKCGVPAEHRVRRPAQYLKDDWKLWKPFALILGLYYFPPVFVLIVYRWGQVVWVGVPMCDDHRSDWDWRDRAEARYLYPIWTAVVVVLDLCGLVMFVLGVSGLVFRLHLVGAFFYLAGPIVLVLVLMVEGLVIQRGAVLVVRQQRKGGILVKEAHEAFTSAVIEERARAQVTDPMRRLGKGDIKEDYDEEPT